MMAATVSAGQPPLPFNAGEKLTYSVRWEMVRAGKAEFLVHGVTTLDDQKAWFFELNVKSNKYVDVLYKIRDRYRGFTDSDFTHSVLYARDQSGKEKREVRVKFDWKKNTATYSNYGGKREPIEIPPHTFDPLTSIYKMRLLDLKANETITFPVTDGKKQFIQTVHVKEKQTLSLQNGPVDTWLLVPELNHFSGVFERSKDADVKVWITADEKKIPVRIEVKVFIGSVIFDLMSQSG